MLDAIHRQFIAAVQQGRGDRLQKNPDVFSGLMWTGEQGVHLGLVDQLGDVRYVAEEVIGEKTMLDYTKHTRWVERLLDGTEAGMSAVLRNMLGLNGTMQWR